MVTNPATRDVTVTASTFATLNEMFGNRTVCGIGRGDSAVRVLERQARHASPSFGRSRPDVIKDLANDRETEVGGGTHLRLPLEHRQHAGRVRRRVRPEGTRPRPVRSGDGFILQLADLSIAEWSMQRGPRGGGGRGGSRPGFGEDLRGRACVRR